MGLSCKNHTSICSYSTYHVITSYRSLAVIRLPCARIALLSRQDMFCFRWAFRQTNVMMPLPAGNKYLPNLTPDLSTSKKRLENDRCVAERMTHTAHQRWPPGKHGLVSAFFSQSMHADPRRESCIHVYASPSLYAEQCLAQQSMSVKRQKIRSPAK